MTEQLVKVCFNVTSYFPGSVNGGYIVNCPGVDECIEKLFCEHNETIKTGIVTPTAGSIHFSFYGTIGHSMAFSKALQMSVSRLQHPVRYAAINPAAPEIASMNRENFPLFPDERVMDKVEGIKEAAPFCGQNSTFGRLCYCMCEFCMCFSKPTFLCSKENCGKCFFPMIPSILTLGWYPLWSTKQFIVTDTALISYIAKERQCYACDSCNDVANFGLTWVTTDFMLGHELEIANAGSEDFCSRLCVDNVCGRVCCPINVSEFEFSVQLKRDLHFTITKSAPNHNWLQDERVLKNVRAMDHFQHESIPQSAPPSYSVVSGGVNGPVTVGVQMPIAQPVTGTPLMKR